MNIVLLTSCNRIKQCLLSLSLNSQIIKEPFSVIIADNSTPTQSAEDACNQHQAEDPYNVVKVNNYCSDINLLYEAHQYFTNVVDFKVIHTQPRLTKQRGEATLVGLGIMQAALLGNRHDPKQNFCIKLTGTSILQYDIVSILPQLLQEADVLTFHRANIGGYERSTRIFGCRPDIMAGLIAKEGWYDWVDDNSAIFEQRFANLINRKIPDRINYTGHDESGILLEGGMAMQQSYGRERILNFIDKNGIIINNNPYLQEFMDGGIW